MRIVVNCKSVTIISNIPHSEHDTNTTAACSAPDITRDQVEGRLVVSDSHSEKI